MKRWMLALVLLITSVGSYAGSPAWFITVEKINAKGGKLIYNEAVVDGSRFKFDDYVGGVSVELDRITIVVRAPNRWLTVGTTVWSGRDSASIGHISLQERHKTYSITVIQDPRSFQ